MVLLGEFMDDPTGLGSCGKGKALSSISVRAVLQQCWKRHMHVCPYQGPVFPWEEQETGAWANAGRDPALNGDGS